MKNNIPVHTAIIFLSFLFSLIIHTTASTGSPDSLEKVLAGTESDTDKARIMIKLVWAYYHNDYQKAVDYGKKALAIAQKHGHKKIASGAYNALGAAYYEQSELPLALDNYLQSLRLREERKDTLGIAASYSNIGSVYYAQRNLSKALEFYRKSLEMKKAVHDTNGIAYSLNTLAAVYFDQKRKDTAESLFLESLKFFERMGDQTGLAQAYANLAVICKEKKEYKKALDYNYKALLMDSALNDLTGIMTDIINLADILRIMGRPREAIGFQHKALTMAFEFRNFEYIKFAYNGLSASYEDLHLPDSALKYHKLYADYRDSLFTYESSLQVNELQTQYQTEKKEKENELLRKEKELQRSEINRQRYMIVSIAAVLILLSVMAVFIYRGYLQKKKANINLERKNATIMQQKDEIAKQKKIVEEKNRDIMDSIDYAQRIQRALLTSDEYFRNHFNDFFVLYFPKDVVSGDFFWCYADISNHRSGSPVLLATADCTGHGVPGAILSMLGLSFLNEITIERNVRSPEKILDALRNEIVTSLNPEGKEDIKDGMDISLCQYDLASMTIRIASANRPVIIARNGELTEIQPDEMPVGVDAAMKSPFTLKTLPLIKGDMVYCFTDGFSDQFGSPPQSPHMGGSKTKKFGKQRLKALFAAISQLPAIEQKKALTNTFEDWKGSGEQTDDVTVIGIRI